MDNTPQPVAPVPTVAPSTVAAAPVPSLLQQHALPAPTTDVPAVPSNVPPRKHFLAAFFLAFFLGVFGADRFYLGYYGQGTLKLLTFGWFGIGAIIDLGIIMGGGMRDAKDRPLLGYDEYKGLAKRTTMWVSVGGVGLLLLVLASCAVVLLTVLPTIGPLFNNGLDAISGGQLGSPPSSSSSNNSESVDSLLKQLQ